MNMLSKLRSPKVPSAERGFLDADTANAICRAAAEVGNKHLMVLSDFDNTLGGGVYIRPDVVMAARRLDVVVATGRSAEETELDLLWRSGLIPHTEPVIAENGGVLASWSPVKGSLDLEYLVTDEQRNEIADTAKRLDLELDDSFGRRVYLAQYATMLELNLLSRDPADFSDLAEHVDSYLDPTQLKSVYTNGNVTVQGLDVSKASGFEAYLQKRGLKREDLFVVGMGDALNDTGIFASADLSIGFSSDVAEMVDIVIPDRWAVMTAAGVLNAIRIGRDHARR